MQPRILVNGHANQGIPGDDPGLTMGLSVFEAIRVYGEAPFRLDAHMARFEQSARWMGLAMPPREVWLDELRAVLVPDGWLRLLLTAGGNRVVQGAALEVGKVGGPMRLASVVMTPPAWLPGSIKHTSRAAWLTAASRAKVDEVVLVDEQGFILEANRSNFFAVLGGVLWTPPVDGRCLEGVTRGAMLDAAQEAGIPAQVGPVPLDAPFEEVYVASTLKELSPVVELDGRRFEPGPVGARLYDAFRALVARERGVA
jgi:branched-subunit amino acid aminotransferase/4-amino-4-deoxychorismate lyase